MKHKFSAFTLFEIIIVLAIFMLSIVGLSIPVLRFLSTSQIDSAIQGITHKLKLAQANSQMNLQSSKWGVYLDDNGDDSRYVFFRGESWDQYPSSQQSYDLPPNVQFGNIALSQESTQIVFDEQSGNTPFYGFFELIHSNLDQVYTISINPLGIIEIDS